MTSYLYLHGFSSSPASTKAQYFRARFGERGIDLQIPELDGGDFENLTLTGQLRVIAEEVGPGPLVLLGSSMGGYLAALYAEQHSVVERLVLLAPAFDFKGRWPNLVGKDRFEQWSVTGVLPVFHYGQNRERLVGYGLYKDALRYPPYPTVAQPALVLHGAKDDVVPVEASEHFCRKSPNAALHILPSGHELTDALDQMWELIERFLFGSVSWRLT